MCSRTSGHGLAHPPSRKNRGLVTINGVQLDYGSYEHYKAYQKARKHRKETQIPETKQNPGKKQEYVHDIGIHVKTEEIKDEIMDISENISIKR